jgi:predicted nucleotidyltransferase
VADSATILDAVRATLRDEPELRWAYVFGSVARGEAHRDVDVAIMPVAGALRGGVAFGQLIAKLEAAVGAKVDLVDLRSAELPLAGSLLRERRIVVDREPEARQSWEADTTIRWIDFEPSYVEFLDRRSRAMRQRLGTPG